jgi:hypothetical protein
MLTAIPPSDPHVPGATGKYPIPNPVAIHNATLGFFSGPASVGLFIRLVSKGFSQSLFFSAGGVPANHKSLNHSILPTLLFRSRPFARIFINRRLRNPVLLARPRSQIEHSAPLAAKRKIRIPFAIRLRLADGTSVFHARWILSHSGFVVATGRLPFFVGRGFSRDIRTVGAQRLPCCRRRLFFSARSAWIPRFQ